LLTLRADFFSQALSLTRELSDRMQQGIVTLGPLRGSELSMVIEEPARKVGLRFESGLATPILRDVESQPDSLPLLEYALTELWKQKQSTLMAHAQYAAIGGVEGAIGKRADEVLACLPLVQQDHALHALTQLVQVSIDQERGPDTRRRVRL